MIFGEKARMLKYPTLTNYVIITSGADVLCHLKFGFAHFSVWGRLASYLAVLRFHSLPKWGGSKVISEYFITNSESNSRASCHQGKPQVCNPLLSISQILLFIWTNLSRKAFFALMCPLDLKEYLGLVISNEKSWFWQKLMRFEVQDSLILDTQTPPTSGLRHLH